VTFRFLFSQLLLTEKGSHDDNNAGADCTSNHKKSPPICYY